MRKVTLLFPGVQNMADFLFDHPVCSVEANTSEGSVTSVFSDKEIVIACTQYKAVLKRMFTFSTDAAVDDQPNDFTD